MVDHRLIRAVPRLLEIELVNVDAPTFQKLLVNIVTCDRPAIERLAKVVTLRHRLRRLTMTPRLGIFKPRAVGPDAALGSLGLVLSILELTHHFGREITEIAAIDLRHPSLDHLQVEVGLAGVHDANVAAVDVRVT